MGQGLDGWGAFTSLGHNLIGNTDGSSGWVDSDLLNVDPLLGPLQDNGGPTMTMALLPGSPAIDAGIAVEGVTTDQRGISRTISGPPDIGAFEFAALTMNPIVVNDGAAQRSNDTTVAVTFNQWTNIQTLIDDQTDRLRRSALRRRPDPAGGDPIPLRPRHLHPDHRPDAHRQPEDHARGRPLSSCGSTPARSMPWAIPPIRWSTTMGLRTGSSPPGSTSWWATSTATGRSTLADRTQFLQHYGSKLGQSLYDYAFDLNGDGVINLVDYLAWTRRLGRKV